MPTERGAMLRQLIRAGGGLLNQVQVGKVIDRNKSTTHHTVQRKDFPPPVGEVSAGVKVWLHEEVEAWARRNPKQGPHTTRTL